MSAWQDALGGRSSCEPATGKVLQTYAGRIPAQLMTEWRDQGLCAYGDGLLWLVDPDSLAEVIPLWLDQEPSPLCIARSAFGDLLLWDELQGGLYLDIVYDNTFELGSDFEAVADVLSGEDFRLESLRQPLFDEAKARLGPLARDEVYAFEPAPSLGGPGTIETVQKAKLKEYLALMAQFR